MVSIIVPVYNAEKYLDKCINSLINQTFENIEIILINDGSTDYSLEICKRFQQSDNRIKVISKENGGASSARNAGIKSAIGDYIMFADSDDYVAESWVSEMLIAQQQHKDAFVICDINWEDVDGTIYSQHDELNSKLYELKDYYELIENKVFNQPYNKIFSTEVLVKNNIFFNEDLTIGEDINFNLDYLACCKQLLFLNKKLYYYLENREDSLCHRYYDDLFEINLFTYEHNLKLFNDFGVDDDTFKRLKIGFVGSVTDCLDREITNKDKASSAKNKRMKEIMCNSMYLYTLLQINEVFNAKRFFVLKSKSPFLYKANYLLSKCFMRRMRDDL